MKYIVTKDEKGKEEMFTFPDSVHHNVMADAVSYLKNQTHDNWKRINRDVVSAGFIEGGVCVGKSESLGLSSRPEDTELFNYN